MSLRRGIFVLVVFIALGYFFFEARGVLFAPPLYIFEPHDNVVLKTTRIHIAGATDPGLHILVHGQDFIAGTNGAFDGFITLDPGYNELGFLARDRFGNETRRVLKVVIE